VDPVDEALERLSDVKGFGPGRIENLIKGCGGKKELLRILEEGDVSTLSSLDRISERMAVELIIHYRGDDPRTILRTEGSIQVYQDIISLLGSYMQTSYGKNRTSLLLPGGDLSERMKDSNVHFQMKDLLQGVDRDHVQALLKKIDRSRKDIRTKKKLDYIIMVESDECYDVIRNTGIDRRCLVISPDEYEGSMEGDLILVYDRLDFDETQVPFVSSVHFSSDMNQLVPEMVLDVYGGRDEQLKALVELEELFSREGKAQIALDSLEELGNMVSKPEGPEAIKEEVESIRVDVETSLKLAIEDLTLSGSDALSLLSSDEPPALRKVYNDHSKMAMERVLKAFGRRSDLFEMNFPLKVNQEALDRMINDIEGERSQERFSRKQKLANELSEIWNHVQEEINWAKDLDFRFSMGCFVKDHDLKPFKISEDWFGISKACHLMIRSRKERQLIDYHLGPVPGYAGTYFPFRQVSHSRSSILTGANSGGKTTLLETVSHVLIMARMGLPVPADVAFIPEIDNIFLYKPKRRLDAGGLESFLKELLPLVLEVDTGSMVLADELEAMTELEAASKMIGVFIEELQKRNAYSIIVTHMADEICRFVDCRVDGIEARGLDDNYELIVDRSPMIGKHARSTPELILKKLEARSKGEERSIYAKVLSKFDQ
jgi:hypothetical protein